MPRRVLVELIRADGSTRPYEFDGEEKRYIFRGPQGRTGEAVMPWKALAPDLDLLMSRPWTSPHHAARVRVGQHLRRFLEDVLKPVPGWHDLASSISSVQEVKDGGRRRLHLAFRFQPGELFSLPWALTEIDQTGGTLGLAEGCVLQFEWAGVKPAAPCSLAPRDRLLFAWSSRGRPVPAAEHLQVLRQTWGDSFQEEEDHLEGATLEGLRRKLQGAAREKKPFQVIHLLCHGGRTPDRTFGLALDDEPIVDGNLFRSVLEPHARDLKLVVLCACESSNPGSVGSLYGGVAHELNGMGIPAVVASQAPLSCDGSVKMARALYEALRSGGAPVQEAFLQARNALERLSLDWASLQLFAPSEAGSGDRSFDLSRRTVFKRGSPLPASGADNLVVTYEVNLNIPATPVIDTLQVLGSHELETVALRPLKQVEDGLPASEKDWTRAFSEAAAFERALKERETESDARPAIHLFGCAPLPLMFHLGWRLGRRRVRVYQQARLGGELWSAGYDSLVPADGGERFFRIDSWPDADACRAAGGRVGLTVEVTNRMNDDVLARSFLHEGVPVPLVRLTTARGPPSREAVRDLMDTSRAVAEFSECLEKIHTTLPDVREVWLALWCPASMAAALGRDYHVKDWPALVLLTFRKTSDYVPVHRIEDRRR